MLDLAFFYNEKEINEKIIKENTPYYVLGHYKTFDNIKILNDEYEAIQRVSVDENGNVIAFFSATIDQINKRITSVGLIKFKKDKFYKYDIAYSDLRAFLDLLLNSKIYRYIEFMAIADNPANSLYEELIKNNNGYRCVLKEYVLLNDGLYHDVYIYYIPTRL